MRATPVRGETSSGQSPGVQRTEQAVGAVPALGQSGRRLVPARRVRVGDLPGGVRVQMGPVTLGTLKPGAWRELTQEEIGELMKLKTAAAKPRAAKDG